MAVSPTQGDGSGERDAVRPGLPGAAGLLRTERVHWPRPHATRLDAAGGTQRVDVPGLQRVAAPT